MNELWKNAVITVAVILLAATTYAVLNLTLRAAETREFRITNVECIDSTAVFTFGDGSILKVDNMCAGGHS